MNQNICIRRAQLASGVASFVFAAALASPAAAQSSGANDAGEIKEIVVTAAKAGAQSLQKTPLAIQAFSGDALKEQNINRIDDLIQLIPGASENSSSGIVNRSFNLRGVGGTSGTNGDSPIGYYLDDVPFNIPNFGIAPPVSFVDLERVEVLRGPQGTLYGQGSAGGTMIFHTKDPDLNDIRFAGEAILSKTQEASKWNHGVNAAVSIPLVKDKLAIRVSGNYLMQEGYADVYNGPVNTGTPDRRNANFSESKDIRAVVLWKPVDNLKLRGQVWYIKPYQGFNSGPTTLDPPAFLNVGGVEGYSRGEFTLYSLSGQLDLNGVSINSATSYINGSFDSLFPLGGGADFLSAFKPTSFSQELRVSSNGKDPLHWVIGGQYQDGKGPQRNIIDLVSYVIDGSNNTVTKNWAVFGETSYGLFDGKVVPLIGLRYYHDKRSYIEGANSQSQNLNKLTWRANLSFLPTDNLTAFVTASTGFRAGIIQSQAAATFLQDDGVPGKVQNNPDSLTNYEAGVKYRTADGVFSFGANLYHIKFKDMQTSINTSAGVGAYVNLGDAHTTGVDLEMRVQTPLRGLSLSGVANFNDSKFDEVNAIVASKLPTVRRGAKLVGNAAYNFRVDANYNTSIGNDFDLFSNVGYSRTGSRIMSDGSVTKDYGLLGATLGLRKGPWEVALVGENLTDTRGPTYIFTPTVIVGPRPRTLGVRLRANY